MYCIICIWSFLDELIVVYIPIVYFIEVKLKLTSTLFSLWTNYYFVIESVHAFSFVNNVVYEVFLVLGRCDKLSYKIFIGNVVSRHLSSTWQFWPFRSSWTSISWEGLSIAPFREWEKGWEDWVGIHFSQKIILINYFHLALISGRYHILKVSFS